MLQPAGVTDVGGDDFLNTTSDLSGFECRSFSQNQYYTADVHLARQSRPESIEDDIAAYCWESSAYLRNGTPEFVIRRPIGDALAELDWSEHRSLRNFDAASRPTLSKTRRTNRQCFNVGRLSACSIQINVSMIDNTDAFLYISLHDCKYQKILRLN